MTNPSSSAPPSAVQWTQQRKNLWTGRRAGMPAGTIEHGRRYTYVDVHGVAVGHYRSLEAAKEGWRPRAAPANAPTLRGPFLAGASMAAATVGALLVFAGPHLR